MRRHKNLRLPMLCVAVLAAVILAAGIGLGTIHAIHTQEGVEALHNFAAIAAGLLAPAFLVASIITTLRHMGRLTSEAAS